MPWEFLAAVKHAETILSWRENLTDDEMPPTWMWPFAEQCSDWIAEAVEARRNGNSSARSGPSTRNELLDSGGSW